ncbi:hypothetical protein VNO80_01683 [Phaseolus coccineus]|uniref:Uncharacterized protein n=1 Tax=Phaseolus coccineus TaxID=3886 RepID=A0AAN9RT26_PHACN
MMRTRMYVRNSLAKRRRVPFLNESQSISVSRNVTITLKTTLHASIHHPPRFASAKTPHPAPHLTSFRHVSLPSQAAPRSLSASRFKHCAARDSRLPLLPPRVPHPLPLIARHVAPSEPSLNRFSFSVPR